MHMCKENTMLMFAYGLNTNLSQMSNRCPAAQSLGPAILLDHVFRFAQHADVGKSVDSCVYGVIWSITPECLRVLDQLEAFPVYYNRRNKRVFFKDRVVHAVTYFMQPGHLPSLPSNEYFETLLAGYEIHGISTEQLHNARDAVFL